jgi:hypothetical protein
VTSSVEIIAKEENWTLTRHRNLAIVNWRKKPMHEQEKRIILGLRNMAAAPDRPTLHVLVVVEASASAPDTEVRSAMQDDIRAMGRQVGSLSALLLAEGFIAAAVRAALTGMNVILRESFPTKVFGNAADTAAWLAPMLGGGFTAGEVITAIEQTRRA